MPKLQIEINFPRDRDIDPDEVVGLLENLTEHFLAEGITVEDLNHRRGLQCVSGVIHDDKGAEVGHYKFSGKYRPVPRPKPPKGPRKNARKPSPPTARARKIAEIKELLAAADIEPVAANKGDQPNHA
jgi:hypothetical protein